MEHQARIKILQDLIQIHSVNGNEIEVAKYLKALLAEHGITAHIDTFGEDRADLTAEIGQGKDPRVLAWLGHEDTVAINEVSDWQHDPFEAQIKGDRLYGRGAADMKSGLAAEVIALIELQESNQLPAGRIRLMAAAGEEVGNLGAHRFAAEAAIQEVSAVLVAEASDGNVVFAQSGSLSYQVTSRGKASHSSRPEDGKNALDALRSFADAEATAFEGLPLDQHLGVVKHSITMIQGGNQINTIPDYGTLSGNIRPTPAFNNAQVKAKLADIIAAVNAQGQAQLALTYSLDLDPLFTSPDDPFVQLVLNTSQQHYPDRAIALNISNGSSDANVLIKANPRLKFANIGCDYKDTAHQVDEYTTLSSFHKTIELYKQIGMAYFELVPA